MEFSFIYIIEREKFFLGLELEPKSSASYTCAPTFELPK